MLFETLITYENRRQACREFLDAWDGPEKKVFIFRSGEKIRDVREFYDVLISYLGKKKPLAEDARIGSRNKQRTGKVWTEVRYDPNIPNAYRHSSNAQPLHTDGSYIPNFPTTLLCCVANSDEGGETTFVDSELISNDLSINHPSLFKEVTTETIQHERSGDSRSEKPLYQKKGRWFVNWNYYCVKDDIPGYKKKIARNFQNYLLTSKSIKMNILEVKLTPCDAVIWKDDEVLHGRNAFKATKVSERFIWKCAVAIGEGL